MLVSVTAYNAGSIRVPCTHSHWSTRSERREVNDFSWQDDCWGVMWLCLYIITWKFQLLHHFYSPYYLSQGFLFNSMWEQGNKGLFIGSHFWIKSLNLPMLFQDFFKFCCCCIPYEDASIMRATYYILTIWTEESKRWKHVKFLKLRVNIESYWENKSVYLNDALVWSIATLKPSALKTKQ